MSIIHDKRSLDNDYFIARAPTQAQYQLEFTKLQNRSKSKIKSLIKRCDSNEAKPQAMLIEDSGMNHVTPKSDLKNTMKRLKRISISLYIFHRPYAH